MKTQRWGAGALALALGMLAGCGGGSGTDGTAAGTLESAAASARRSEAVAKTVTAPAATVTIPNGRLLASNCFQCHGTNGVSTGGFDSLAGESVAEIVEELKEMRVKVDEEEGIMRPHALGYTDAQIQSLATYFASQRKP